MKISDILKQYDNEWLLIEVVKFNEDWEPIEGHVLAHSKSKSDIYDALLKYKGKNLSIEYAGEIPQDVAILL